MEAETLLITQARTGSTRLPGKVLKKADGKTLLQIHLERLRRCKNVSEIVVATTGVKEDEEIFKLSRKLGFNSFRGSEKDVLDRFYKASKPYSPNWIVRVTSDCPLLDPELVDQVIAFAKREKVDYVSNSIQELYPDGQDVEVFTFEALETAWKNAEKQSEREHVTPYIFNNSDIKDGGRFTAAEFPCEGDYTDIRMTVDEPRDLELIRKLIQDLGTEKTWKEYTDYIIDKGLTDINEDIIRNEGYLKSLKGD